MVKNDYTLVPFVFNYFPENENQLSFYVELYKSKKVLVDQPFLLNYYIRPFEVDKKMDQYFRMKKASPESVNVLMPSFDISQLPSGNYLLMVEARDRNNELLAQQEFYFQRYNPNLEFNLNSLLVLNTQNSFVGNITNRDTLLQYIQYLYPISTEIEKLYVQNQLVTADLTMLQKYFLNFWIERDKTNPDKAWSDYLTLVNQANHDFKTVSGPGYQSDRGRVYLQYGPPSVISQNYNEPAAYPYEIWQYYKLGNQRDKKFVFYTHDMVTNDFQLIHSNAIGELNYYRWQTIIYRRTWDPNSIDDEFVPDTWGSGATQNYLQPGSR
jgi:GWxTD domain-containing protein